MMRQRGLTHHGWGRVGFEQPFSRPFRYDVFHFRIPVILTPVLINVLCCSRQYHGNSKEKMAPGFPSAIVAVPILI